MFLQLPIHRKTVSLPQILSRNRLKAIQYRKACFPLPFLIIYFFSEDRMMRSSEPVKIRRLELYWNYFWTHI